MMISLLDSHVRSIYHCHGTLGDFQVFPPYNSVCRLMNKVRRCMRWRNLPETWKSPCCSSMSAGVHSSSPTQLVMIRCVWNGAQHTKNVTATATIH